MIYLLNFRIWFFLSDCTACRILVPQPGIKPTPPAVEGQSLNHWISREVPPLFFLYLHFPQVCFIYMFMCLMFGWSAYVGDVPGMFGYL